MITSSVRLSDGSIQRFALAKYPYLAVLKHQFEIDGKSILEHSGYPLWPERPDGATAIPSVVRLVTDSIGFCYFTEAWQRFSASIIKMRIREVMPYYTDSTLISETKAIFRALYRNKAFQTNKFGTDTCHDYVNGTNDDAEDMKMSPVLTGGNLVKVLGDAKLIAGDYYTPIECFNASLPPPDPYIVNWYTFPYLVFKTAYQESRILTLDGGRKIIPFGFRGVDNIPFFLLRRGSNIAWVKSDRIRRI